MARAFSRPERPLFHTHTLCLSLSLSVAPKNSATCSVADAVGLWQFQNSEFSDVGNRIPDFKEDEHNARGDLLSRQTVRREYERRTGLSEGTSQGVSIGQEGLRSLFIFPTGSFCNVSCVSHQRRRFRGLERKISAAAERYTRDRGCPPPAL